MSVSMIAAAARPLQAGDLPALRELIDTVGLFPSELLDGMAAAYLEGETDEHVWLTLDAGTPAGIAYAAPEMLTEGTWNLLLIAVHAGLQGRGMGTGLLEATEAVLRDRGARLLLVDTSGLPEFARTRAFYSRRGYEEEARIRDYYRPGDDKVTFRKHLASSPVAAGA